jgi:hypothetical protein
MTSGQITSKPITRILNRLDNSILQMVEHRDRRSH